MSQGRGWPAGFDKGAKKNQHFRNCIRGLKTADCGGQWPAFDREQSRPAPSCGILSRHDREVGGFGPKIHRLDGDRACSTKPVRAVPQT